MRSVWQETELPRFPHLEGDAQTDVLIIGGGMAGVLTAWRLQQNGVPYILVEKNRLCGENTANTTAKITAQHGLIYDRLTRDGGTRLARGYFDANTAALREFEKLSQSIACDFERKDSYVYADDRAALIREWRALRRIGCEAELCDRVPLPLRTAGAVKLPQQAQFDPMKFVAGLVGGLNVYENTFVREMIGNTAVTERGRIAAKRVVCATHFPFINKHGAYFLKLYQSRSYVLALHNAPDVDGMYVDADDAGLSFRNDKGLLLLGGSGGRTGKKTGGWEALRSFAAEHWPEAREKYFWAAQDCMSLDARPYIGRYGRHTENFYVETGFNKWGMTGSMLAAMIVSDRLLGKENEYAWMFEPDRSILKPQLLVNGAEAVVNLLTPAKRVCPHMGCALKWNPAEHSWDCPCHGSRFTADGEVLNNPANGDL